MVSGESAATLKKMATEFRAIAIVGPRQSGKSTLAKMVLNEMLKLHFNKGKRNNLYFRRDNTGNEIDVIIDNGKQLIPVEIKSGATITENSMKGIQFWQKLTGNKKSFLVYGGTQIQHRSNGTDVLGWESIHEL